MSIRQLETAAAWTGDEVRIAANIATHAEQALREMGDEHGASVARAARDGLRAPTVTMVVAGEFQEGKSSLVNALLGARVTPADPLATTALPVRIACGDEVAWTAFVAPEGDARGAERRAVRADQFDALATATRPELEGRAVAGLEVALDHPLLRAGVTLVDTPCVSGGLSTPAAGIVLGLLQAADGLVFVADASQELTAPEVEFLRMARSLCPSLLVVVSKVDLYPEWRRILDIDQELVTAVDPDAVVLPASSRLRAAAVRHGDAELDRESGIPLVTWYLGTTMLTRARQQAVTRCGNTLETRLTAAIDVVRERIEVLEASSGKRRAEERYERAASQLELLRSEGPKRIRLELRAFVRDTGNDLTDRFVAVNDMLGDLIKGVDPADQWPEIEATLHRATNRALAEHVANLRSRAESVVAALREQFDLDEDRLSIALVDVGAAPDLSPDIDDPDFGTEKATRVHDVVRGAVSTGAMGIGLATSILTGGLAALVLGAGAGLSTVVLTLRRDRTRDLDGRRAKALQASRAWVADARAAVTGYANELHKELEFQLENQIEKGLRSLLVEGEAERNRLEILRRTAAEHVPEVLQRANDELARLELIRAHARRLDHRLARPELGVVAR